MSYRELNQIFYENNKFDIPNNIIRLEPFFYDIHNIINTIDHTKQTCEIETKKNEKKTCSHIPLSIPDIHAETFSNCEEEKQNNVKDNLSASKNDVAKSEMSEMRENKSSLFEPKQTDSIFWCIFVFVYGYSDYLMVGSKYGNRELEEKQKMISYFKTNPKLLKSTNHKITLGQIQEIHAEYLSVQNETTLLGVLGLSVFYNIRILLVDTFKNTYLDFHMTENSTSSKICVLYKNKGIRGKTKYMLDMSTTDDMIDTIQKTMLCLDSYQRPLRAVSTYKVSELEEICKLLGLVNDPTTKRLKKDEIYNKIVEHCGTVQ